MHKLRKIKRSEFQLTQFNNCPGESFLDELGDIELDIVDAEKKYEDGYVSDSYVNSEDTLVIRIKEKSCPIETAIIMSILSKNADEIDVETLDGFAIVRFWWD